MDTKNYDKFLSGYDCFIVKQFTEDNKVDDDNMKDELLGQWFIKRATIGKRLSDCISTTKHEIIPLEHCFSLSQGSEALVMMEYLQNGATD